MKFGAQLERYAVPEWREKYIRYNYLKRFIAKKIHEARRDGPHGTLPLRLNEDVYGSSGVYFYGAGADSAGCIADGGGPAKRAAGGTKEGGRGAEAAAAAAAINRQFLQLLDIELTKVEQHFQYELSFLTDRLDGVKAELSALASEEKIDAYRLAEIEKSAAATAMASAATPGGGTGGHSALNNGRSNNQNGKTHQKHHQGHYQRHHHDQSPQSICIPVSQPPLPAALPPIVPSFAPSLSAKVPLPLGAKVLLPQDALSRRTCPLIAGPARPSSPSPLSPAKLPSPTRFLSPPLSPGRGTAASPAPHRPGPLALGPAPDVALPSPRPLCCFAPAASVLRSLAADYSSSTSEAADSYMNEEEEEEEEGGGAQGLRLGEGGAGTPAGAGASASANRLCPRRVSYLLARPNAALSREDREVLRTFQQRDKDRKCHRARLSRTVVCLCDCLDQLEGFVQLNLVCLYKVLKKRDKLLGLNALSADLNDRKRRLQLLAVQQYVKDCLVRLFNATTISSAVGMGQALSPEDAVVADMQHLSLMVKKHFAASKTAVFSPRISFFLGACMVILGDLVWAAAMLPTNPEFSLGVVLTLFPLFRLALMVVLAAWGAGVVLSVFEYYGVNYKFIMNIDPKCQINGVHLLNLASVLTIVWILIFGAFLLDVKFCLFLPTRMAWAYPLLLFLALGVIFSLPSHIFRYQYRRGLAQLFCHVAASGFVLRKKITLVENVIGDILTSFVKPLVDLHFAVTYLCAFPFLENKLAFYGVPSVDRFALPLIAVLPYWVRLMQCLSRYRYEDPEMRHVHAANMGKYASTLVVIFTSLISWENFGLSIYASRLIFVVTYSFASIYNLIWDVTMDWGLMPDPDNFVRPDFRVMYPQWLYYLISLFNLVGRLTWALTLIPIGIIDDTRFNASLITLVISSIEVFRRSAWLVLRLENEHLTNSSRYRAMLWVPKLASAAHASQFTAPPHATFAASPPASRPRAESLRRFTSVQHDQIYRGLASGDDDVSVGGSPGPGSSPAGAPHAPLAVGGSLGSLGRNLFHSPGSPGGPGPPPPRLMHEDARHSH